MYKESRVCVRVFLVCYIHAQVKNRWRQRLYIANGHKTDKEISINGILT